MRSFSSSLICYPFHSYQSKFWSVLDAVYDALNYENVTEGRKGRKEKEKKEIP
jgi:hypothetical protein